MDSSNWMKYKKATINPINKRDNICFQYAACSHVKFKFSKRSHVKLWANQKRPAENKYNWKGISYLLQKHNWKNLEKNNLTIALNFLYVKKEKLYPAYVSKHNSKCEKQVIILMIPNWEG